MKIDQFKPLAYISFARAEALRNGSRSETTMITARTLQFNDVALYTLEQVEEIIYQIKHPKIHIQD